MRILKASMQSGGYLTPDGSVFVPRRLWVQKGARFIALTAKHECAQAFLTELERAGGVEYSQPEALELELDRVGDTLDATQNSLHRLLHYVPEPRALGGAKDGADASSSSSIGKLTERFKGLAKTLDKTAARLGAMPTKCNDPAEYISTLIRLFEAAGQVERWIEHYLKAGQATYAPLLERLHRCATFMYEVVCAFVVQDLDGLIQRHMRKASVGLIKGPNAERESIR